MKVNWRVRIKNPVFLGEIACAIILPALAGLGMQWDDMTSWGALIEAVKNAFLNPVIVVSIVVSLFAAINDPTTTGIGDSTKALNYTEPKAD